MKRNTEDRWGSVSIALHWTIAFLIILVQVPLGLIMTFIEPGTLQNILFTAHKMTGIVIFIVAVIRLGWRWSNPVPKLPPDLANWQVHLASCTQALLYLLLFALPITGFLYTAMGGYPVPLFGLGDIGQLVPVNKPLADGFKLAHIYLTYVLYAAAALHVAGALQHHLWRKDGVLVRMTSPQASLPPMRGEPEPLERLS